MARRQRRLQRRIFMRELLRLHNAERRKHGLPALRRSKALGTSALAKSRDMIKHHYFDHGTPHGTWYRFIYKYAGAKWRELGENIARAQDTAVRVFREWMDSPPHRANILARKYKLVGFGFACQGSIEYWVAHFGTVNP